MIKVMVTSVVLAQKQSKPPILIGWLKRDGPSFNADYTKPTKDGPNDHGFDFFFGMNGTTVGSPLVLMENRLVTETPTIKGPKKGRPMAKSYRPVEVIPKPTEEVLKYIDRAAQKPEPFFIYYAMTAVHTPVVPAKRFAGISSFRSMTP
ncbi:hypothetical protein N9B94_00035 [Verrucomicrobia bacterium]|nr:hypothetical protein [Verrucomicrobiota bacterium]